MRAGFVGGCAFYVCSTFWLKLHKTIIFSTDLFNVLGDTFEILKKQVLEDKEKLSKCESSIKKLEKIKDNCKNIAWPKRWS